MAERATEASRTLTRETNAKWMRRATLESLLLLPLTAICDDDDERDDDFCGSYYSQAMSNCLVHWLTSLSHKWKN